MVLVLSLPKTGGPSPIDLGWPETTQEKEEVGRPPPTDVDRPKASPEEQKPEKPTPTDLKNPETPAKEEEVGRPLPTDLSKPKAVPEEQKVENPPMNNFTGQETVLEEKEVEKEKPSDISIPETVPETQKAERLPQNDQIVVSTDKKNKYTGTPITLDFRNTPIPSVLKFMAEINDYNIIIDPEVKGNITIAFHKAVPWDQALDIIMRTCRLSMKIEGKIIRVGPMATFDQEIVIIPINYAQADASLIKKLAPLLSKAKGVLEPPALIIDQRTNSLIIKDVPEKIAKIKEVLAELDKETPQVMILDPHCGNHQKLR